MTARGAAVPGRRDLERALSRTEAGGAASRRVALEEVTRLLFRLDPSDVTPALAARATAAGAPRDALEASTSRPPHAVLAPLVLEGDRVALVRTFYVSLDPSGASPGAPRLEPDAEASVESALGEARRLASAPPSGRFRLVSNRHASAASSGADELRGRLAAHTGTGPAITAGDVDANWEAAETVGDEAPGGDNPTPDQDVVDEIGKALGVEYDDDEELQGGDEIAARDHDRWELDPASSDDFDER